MIDVSIVIPSFNRAKLIGRAIRSCLAQTCSVEVVIVDDGSTDDTVGLIRQEFGDDLIQDTSRQTGPLVGRSSIRLLRQANLGACAARNHGLHEACGEFVKFLDSDDELIPGALGAEVSLARESGADVVVSAWEERSWGDGGEELENRRQVACPSMQRGIDDMLKGESPWTAAALYRREFVGNLTWNAEFGKADDWGWAWTVCLAGARYASTDSVSAIYWHHADERITSARSAFTDSTLMRQRILSMVETKLATMNALTPERRRALSQYVYKDRLVLCEMSVDAWRKLWRHCQDLAPGYRPFESHRLVRPLVTVLGPFQGVRLYVRLRSVVRFLKNPMGYAHR